jgi:hypothetical protein
MSAHCLRHIIVVLAAVLFVLHVQAMDHARAAPHAHVADVSSSVDHEDSCGLGCCAASACCVQAVEADVVDLPERHSPVFGITSQRVPSFAAFGPPDPPPRSSDV